MRAAAPPPRRTALLLVGAGLVAAALLTGCDDDPGTVPAAATGPATATPAAGTGSDDLAAGLLPARAFGNGATVTPLPLDRLPGTAPMAAPEGLSVDPADCLAAAQALLPQLAAVDDAAAQVARGPGSLVTVEALARSASAADAVPQLQGLAGRCRDVEVSAGAYGSGHVTVTPVADLGWPLGQDESAAAVTITVTASGPDGRAWSGTGVAGLVRDGDRVLVLAQADLHGGQVGTASFTDLLRTAYEAQTALG